MKKTMSELFAGVGGFRVGLERLGSGWETTWFSQWEPGTKKQWAHDCYVSHFGSSPNINGIINNNEDISTVDKNLIPDHTLLVGGFPCQDYSVARSLSNEQGIEGKKGVLWWQIRDTIIAKNPAFCLFENVDRLLKSPSKQRGRDFGVILSCLEELDYNVEWRVVNAAEYGASQRRRRVFIFAYKKNLNYAYGLQGVDENLVLSTSGFMAKAFPIETMGEIKTTTITNDILEISNNFSFAFENAGYMKDGVIYTSKVTSKGEQPILLKDILIGGAPEKYYIDEEKLPKWEYLKGGKKIPRVTKEGFEYTFSEGPIAFPDPADRPGRTMLTSEATLNRSSHVVKDPETGRLRTLTPVEAERLQGFDDNWTDSGMPDRARYFCMGNALVVPMITRMGKVLDEIIERE